MDIQLRKATKSDWDFILELRNNDFQYFYEQNSPIPKEAHYQYMENHVNDSNFHQWIISHEGNDVGYVRILNEDVGIMVKKEAQGKGIASKALDLLEREAVNLGIKKLVALIHPKNQSSEKIFKKNGYDLKLYRFEKKLTD
ncbi:MAG: GNAT family N-acetyltransferase [Nitrosarchaeum sp.]|nr:GNAT family N-acetyltransferase [Nitrosarchaeum sp.]